LLLITVRDFHHHQLGCLCRRALRQGRLLPRGCQGAPCRLSLLLSISSLQISSLWICLTPPKLLLYPHVPSPAIQHHSLQCKIYKIIFKNSFVLLECQHYHLAESCVTMKQKKDSKDKGMTNKRENKSKE
jgi:hypothetical protein